jgi:hypothetical protein
MASKPPSKSTSKTSVASARPATAYGGLRSAPVPSQLPYALACNKALASNLQASPMLLYAISVVEMIAEHPDDGATRLQDGYTDPDQECGHGLCQLDSSWPADWKNPQANYAYAYAHFLEPALQFWREREGLLGDDLVRAAAATYNAGLGGAIAGHKIGDVDAYTTDRYGSRVLHVYRLLGASNVSLEVLQAASRVPAG